jgi:hypothetical protein
MDNGIIQESKLTPSKFTPISLSEDGLFVRKVNTMVCPAHGDKSTHA